MKLAVLGSGPGGYVAAIRAAQLGLKVTVIEARKIGGSCLNWGCIPTKILSTSAGFVSLAKRCPEFGIEITGRISPHLKKILERKDRIVGLHAKGIRNLFKKHGITLKEGHGEIVSPSEISVLAGSSARETVQADRIIIATGSRPRDLPASPFDGKRILSTDDVFSLDAIPKSIVIIGAGVSGCEFACVFAQLGTDVTLLEELPRALFTEDIEISQLFMHELKKRGIRLLTGIAIVNIDLTGDAVRVLLNDGREIKADKALVSAGRILNSDGMGAEKTGISKKADGEIIVNQRMETNIAGIYAVGDVIGGHLLAHVASAEGLVAAANCAGGDEHIDYTAVPSAIFTAPEIASVGLREQNAAEMGINIRTGHFQFRSLAKSHIIGEIYGMVKVISDKKSDKVLGVHIIGPHASDLIHEGALAISRGLLTKDISSMMHAHPTLSEVLQEAFSDVHGLSIHS